MIADKQRRLDYYSYDKIDFCRQNKKPTPITFTAEVYQYHPVELPIEIHVCKWFVEDFICHEQFFGAKEERHLFTEIQTHAEQCRTALKQLVSPHGHKIYKVNNGLYRTKTSKSYDWSRLRLQVILNKKFHRTYALESTNQAEILPQRLKNIQ